VLFRSTANYLLVFVTYGDLKGGALLLSTSIVKCLLRVGLGLILCAKAFGASLL
jgi:hypothetical protein